MRSTPTNRLIIAAALLLGLVSSTARAQRDPGSTRGGSDAQEADDQIDKSEGDRIARIASRFRGTVFIFDQSITPETIAPGAQLSQVPSYQWWMSARPRFYIRPDLSLRARLDMTIEWLNGGSETTLKRQAMLGDLWLDLTYTPKPFFGIQSSVTLRTIFPTSLAAQANSSVVRAGPSVSLARPFRTRIGEIEPSLGLYALYNFVMNTSAGVKGGGYGCTTTEYTPAFCDQNSGAMNSQVQFVASTSLRYSPHPKWNIGVSYLVLDNWVYRTPDVTLNGPQGSTDVPHSENDTRFRQSSWFLASVDYDPVDWVELSLGYYTFRSIRDPNGQIGNPFYKADGGSRVFLSTTFAFDKIYETIARRRARKHHKSTATQASAEQPSSLVSF